MSEFTLTHHYTPKRLSSPLPIHTYFLNPFITTGSSSEYLCSLPLMEIVAKEIVRTQSQGNTLWLCYYAHLLKTQWDLLK